MFPRCSSLFVLYLLCGLVSAVEAQVRQYRGVETVFDAIDPTVMKWYRPQSLYYQYDWNWWEYTNYARNPYERYVNIELEGTRWYDLYGDYITKGWHLYEWRQDVPKAFGSSVTKRTKFRDWFSGLVIGKASKGQYYVSTTVGEKIRATLTPFTFSKPTFNGVQIDFLSDKYAFTSLMSRVDNPTWGGSVDVVSTATDYVNFVGIRGTMQLGDFLKVGGNYVNAHLGRTSTTFDVGTSMKGTLTTVQNRDFIRSIVIRIRDDSPDDGRGGGLLFSEKISIDGRVGGIQPLVEGGFPRGGALAADGQESITLTYTIPDPQLRRRIAFDLVLANDYLIEVSSNLQTNRFDQIVFLPVTRAEGNVTDGSNQRVVHFDYGLPTANEIYGFTIEAHDIMGFMAQGELNINNRYKKFPNINFKDHHLAFNREHDRSTAFYAAIRKLFFPWTGYLEIFQIDSDYTTSMYLPSSGGIIDYEDPFYRYEFVDDNDDKDQWADWTRVNTETEGFLGAVGLTNAAGVFPGLDENNDFISDFNQNNNLWPDYDEPFLRYHVDPPEFLFGLDLDHNTIIDRFEDDAEPDFLYPKGHRGFNAYGGLEVAPGVDVKVGRLYERLLSDNRRSRATYMVLKTQRDMASIGHLQAFAQVHRVKDNIPDDQFLWIHPAGTRGGTREFQDPLVAQDVWMNTLYVDVAYSGIPGLTANHKMKYENYLQRGESFVGAFTAGTAKSRLKDALFLGVIDRVDYRLDLSKGFRLHPKWKSTYRRRTPLADQLPKGALGRLNEQHNLSETFFLTTTLELMPEMWLKAGLETGLLVDFLDHPEDDWEDHRHLISAIQISFLNQSYLGYDMRVDLGLQKEWRWLKSTTERNTSTFVTIFAGAGG